MTRANRFLASENLAKPTVRCKLFHVERCVGSGNPPENDLNVPYGTILGHWFVLVYVRRFLGISASEHNCLCKCSTWNDRISALRL